MTTYLITGASRGLGYEFVRQLSKDSANTVFGLVRNKSKTDDQVKADGINTSSNVHMLEGDITNYKSLTAARSEVEKISPKIDVLINNAAALTGETAFNRLSDFQDDPDFLIANLQVNFNTNVIGVINTINAFLPLILKSDVKKVITITTGLADDSLTNEFDIYEAAPYSISKAALNTAVAKYNAAHGKSTDGVLFMALSPGMVDTGNSGQPPVDSTMPQKFMKAFPKWAGPITPDVSVEAMMKVINRASVNDKNFAGGFVSHFGDKQWL